MSLNTLETARSNGDIIDASHINEIVLALIGAFVGRNATGVPTPYQSLGTKLIPWDALYARTLVIDGKILDPAEITSKPTRIISGRTRTTSKQSDFLRANGVALSFKILANDADLVLSVNDTPVTIDEDITVTGVVAAPSSNNTCQVNELTIPPPLFTATTGGIYLGEDGDYITLDSMGSAVSAKVGQIVAFRASYNDGTTTHIDIMYGLLESTTKLTNVFRGFFFDKDGNPYPRSNYLGNDTILTLMSLGWVFVDVNGVTVEVSYKTPVFSGDEPASPASGDYWYDQTIDAWKRYNGSAWIQVNRALLGFIVADSTACIAARSFNFDKRYKDTNTLELMKGGQYIVQTKNFTPEVSVNGSDFEYNNISKWDLQKDIIEMPNPTNPNDLALGDVYLYITETGKHKASIVKPYDRRLDMEGFYHPYESWRCVGKVYMSTDFAVTELGIFSSVTIFPYNPKARSPRAFLQNRYAANTGGGASSVGINSFAFNTTKDDDACFNALSYGGAFGLNFSRGTYEVELSKAGYQVNNHKVAIVDQINGQIFEMGIMNTSLTGVQSEATLKAVFDVRAQQCVPSLFHFCAAADANGMGKVYDPLSPYPEVYAQMIVTKIK